MEQLSNAVWHALTGPQQAMAEGGALAVRFDPAVSVFAALPDEAGAEAWQQLAELVGPGNMALLFRDELDLPDGWTEAFGGIGRQMVWPGSSRRPATGDGAEVVQLDADDVPEMVALVERTEPGPFSARTIELGTYLGVRDPADGRLIAMAGQRLHPPGHVEISAVCTDVDWRGRGLARLLVDRLVDEIRLRDEVPILHAAATNVGAIRLYESMGFETVREVRFAALQAPGRSGGQAEVAVSG